MLLGPRGGGLNLLTTGIVRHLAWEAFVQYPFDGLTCTQYPEFFSKFGKYPNSQVVEAYVRVPYQQLDEVVFTVKQEQVM